MFMPFLTRQSIKTRKKHSNRIYRKDNRWGFSNITNVIGVSHVFGSKQQGHTFTYCYIDIVVANVL